jgi:hypothetical protein
MILFGSKIMRHEVEAHAAIFPRNNDGRVADGHIICVALGRARDRYGIWIAGWRDHLRRALCHWPNHAPLQFMSGVAAGYFCLRGFRNRTPRPPPFSSRNSIPAASIAFCNLT